MNILISISLFFISLSTLAENCPNLNGRWGLYTTNFLIEQTNCKAITMYGREPVSNLFMASGKNQPTDNQFYEYIPDAGNELPFISTPNTTSSKYRIRTTFVNDTLVIDEYSRQDPSKVWNQNVKREFTIKNGNLLYRFSRLDWLGKPYVSEHMVPKYSVR